MHKKNSKSKKIQPQSIQPKAKQKSFDQSLKSIKSVIVDRSITAFNKFLNKLSETPSVYILPIQNRKSGRKSQSKLSDMAVVDTKSKEFEVKKRSVSTFTNRDEDRLKQLLEKRSNLMSRLKAIDNFLSIRNTVPITAEINLQRDTSQNINISRFRQNQSRIHMQNNQAYNLLQHEKNVEMLSRLNNQRMRRQQKLISDMRKKQQNQIRKLQEVQRNRSQLQLSRQLRPLTVQKLKFGHLQQLKNVESVNHIPVTNNDPFQSQPNHQKQISESSRQNKLQMIDNINQ